jgi:hypothetical protein
MAPPYPVPEPYDEGMLDAGGRRDIDWLYRAAGQFYPEEWERLRAGAGTPRDGDIAGHLDSPTKVRHAYQAVERFAGL